MTRHLILASLLFAMPAFAQEPEPASQAAPGAPSGGGGSSRKSAAPAPSPAPAAQPAPAATAAPAPAATKSAKAAIVDINACPVEDLTKLGIAPDVAQKIIAGRPYKGKDELLKRGILDKDGYAKVRPAIVAHQPKKAAAPAAAPAAEKK
jgi:hypothetical protein